MWHHHGQHCGCHACKTIVYPTKHNCVNKFSESTVNHVHPSHTTVMKHHLVKNKHFYPHSTSVQNTCNSVDQFGGAFETPPRPNQVAGAYSPPGGPGGYGMGPGAGPGQVMGATQPGYGMHQGHHWHKHGKWC